MRVKKLIWLIVGCIGLGIGAVGAVLPLLPTFPFLMLAAFGFAKSSDRLHNWFVGTKLYKDNLESYVQGKGMTWAAKRRVISMVTILMGFGLIMMLLKAAYIPCIILFVVWVFHMVYFIFGVKSLKENKAV